MARAVAALTVGNHLAGRVRPMKMPVLFLALAASVCAQSETLDLGPRRQLTLYLVGDWKVDTTHFARQGTMIINPAKESVNASCTLTVTFPEVDRFDTKGRLKLRVEADCYGAAEGSVEGKAVAREFNVAAGFGFYCSFTDPDLRGKPPEKGNYTQLLRPSNPFAALSIKDTF